MNESLLLTLGGQLGFGAADLGVQVVQLRTHFLDLLQQVLSRSPLLI